MRSRSLCLCLLATASLATAARAQQPLPVPGFREASVVVPADASRPLPVVVVLHGNYDRPEWVCAAWAGVVRGRAFILCPRGLPRRDAPPGEDRWTHNQPRALVREVAAARVALAARHPGRVDDGPDVWVGFSLGAHRAARLATRDPDLYPLVQLVEGGDSLFDAQQAARHARARGRVAITCAQRGCERQAQLLTARLGAERAHFERIETCHWCLDVMMPAIVRTFDWLVAGDARFHS